MNTMFNGHGCGSGHWGVATSGDGFAQISGDCVFDAAWTIKATDWGTGGDGGGDGKGGWRKQRQLSPDVLGESPCLAGMDIMSALAVRYA